MDSKDVIKNIGKIYDQLNTPRSLREHMVRAASAADYVCEHYTSKEPMDRDDIIAVLLLHDVGNIAKMDFSSEFNKKMFAHDAKGIEYWANAKEQILKKYKTKDDHELTQRMCEELKLNDRVMYLIDQKIFLNNDTTLKQDDWDLWVSAYIDQRIGPDGIMGLKARLDESRARAKPGSSMADPKEPICTKCAFEIEAKVLARTDLRPEDINDKSVKKYYDKFAKLAGL